MREQHMRMETSRFDESSPHLSSADHGAVSEPSFSLAIANIQIDDASPISIYEQICRAIRTAIASGELPPGTHLPTSRELADALKIGRNTVVTAYSRLAAEGYLLANKRRGTRVAEDAVRLASIASEERPVGSLEPAPDTRTTDTRWPKHYPIEISYRARHILETAVCDQLHLAPFGLNMPDPSLYPRNPLSRLIAEEFCRSPVSSDPQHGRRKFQIVIANYLRHMRGVMCEPAQVIPITGLESALDLTARVMIDPGHWVYVEEPVSDVVTQYLHGAGAQILPVPGDNNGMDIGCVSGPPPRLIFASPSVSFPLGRQMSETRREAMLTAARNWNAVIFENDALWELTYTGGRIRAMQGRYRDAPVIYFGSLNQTLGPHIRAGYLVVPPTLGEPFSDMAQHVAYGPEPFVLAALATFIEDTDYAMHTKSIRSAYAARLNVLVESLRAHLRNVTILEPCGGLHLTILFRDALDENAVCRASAERGLAVTALSRFYHPADRQGCRGVVLGFGNLPERIVETMVCRLAEVVEEAREKSRISASAA